MKKTCVVLLITLCLFSLSVVYAIAATPAGSTGSPAVYNGSQASPQPYVATNQGILILKPAGRSCPFHEPPLCSPPVSVVSVPVLAIDGHGLRR